MSEGAARMFALKRRHLHVEEDRWGNRRIYFRVGRSKRVRIRETPGTEEFDRAYHDLMRRHAAGELKPPARDLPTPGTYRWLCIEHFKSGDFMRLDPRTQRVTRLVVEKTWLEPIAPGAALTFGDCPLSRFDAKAVRILRNRRDDRPEAANNRVRRIRRIFAWALDNDVEGITSNPAREVSFLKPRRAGGFPTWTVADIETFQQCQPVGTKARLAMALLSCTGARRSDIVLLGKQHIREADAGAPDGLASLVFRQFKGRNRTPLTIQLPLLPELQEAIEATQTGDLTFLVTDQGQPFSAAGFGNWFRERCNEAGLKTLSAHGMRKAAATRAAEKGASSHTLMAIFGWRTIKQAEVYTRNADRNRLARAAVHLLGTNGGENSLTSNSQTTQVREPGAKRRG